MATLNAVYRSEAARHGPAVDYFPSGNVLEAPGDAMTSAFPGPGGEVLPWRTEDGIHITSAGALALARALVAQLRAKGWLAKIRPSAGGHKITRRQTAHPVLEAQRGGWLR